MPANMIDEIRVLPIPQKLKQLQEILGLLGVLVDFQTTLSSASAPYLLPHPQRSHLGLGTRA